MAFTSHMQASFSALRREGCLQRVLMGFYRVLLGFLPTRDHCRMNEVLDTILDNSENDQSSKSRVSPKCWPHRFGKKNKYFQCSRSTVIGSGAKFLIARNHSDVGSMPAGEKVLKCGLGSLPKVGAWFTPLTLVFQYTLILQPFKRISVLVKIQANLCYNF